MDGVPRLTSVLWFCLRDGRAKLAVENFILLGLTPKLHIAASSQHPLLTHRHLPQLPTPRRRVPIRWSGLTQVLGVYTVVVLMLE